MFVVCGWPTSHGPAAQNKRLACILIGGRACKVCLVYWKVRSMNSLKMHAVQFKTANHTNIGNMNSSARSVWRVGQIGNVVMYAAARRLNGLDVSKGY